MYKFCICISLIALLTNNGAIASDVELTIKDLIKRMDAKDAVIEILVEKIEHLEGEITKQQEVNAKQAKTNQDLTKKIQELYKELEDTVTEEQFDVTDERHEVKVSKTKNNDLEVKIRYSEGDNKRNDNASTNLKANRDKRHANTNAVAFFAKLTNHLTNLGVGQDVVFDDVTTNIGQAYNSHHGVFIAPTPGIYVFSATLLKAYQANTIDHFIWAKNGQVVCRLYSNTDPSGSTIVVELQQGDDISIQNVDSLNKLHGSGYSFISGFLLKETEPSPVVG
ncbi:heavy metal-binding protein HIP-like [Mya arenaria]|uniref:heavy metal-binding protein HIP-like n=1 Tax=Mya arenaria TaxID=6604 RepID=UPI0022E1C590|nr:heavy metal-binding protein HIP-like [Mya arenaria]